MSRRNAKSNKVNRGRAKTSNNILLVLLILNWVGVGQATQPGKTHALVKQFDELVLRARHGPHKVDGREVRDHNSHEQGHNESDEVSTTPNHSGHHSKTKTRLIKIATNTPHFPTIYAISGLPPYSSIISFKVS